MGFFQNNNHQATLLYYDNYKIGRMRRIIRMLVFMQYNNLHSSHRFLLLFISSLCINQSSHIYNFCLLSLALRTLQAHSFCIITLTKLLSTLMSIHSLCEYQFSRHVFDSISHTFMIVSQFLCQVSNSIW